MESYTRIEVIQFMNRQGIVCDYDKDYDKYYHQWFEKIDDDEFIEIEEN